MKLLNQTVNSYLHKKWGICETFLYILMRVSCKLSILSSTFYDLYKKQSTKAFIHKWKVKKGNSFVFDFDGILLPDVSIDENMLFGLKYVFDDVFIIPISFNNDYSKKNIEFVDQFTVTTQPISSVTFIFHK